MEMVEVLLKDPPFWGAALLFLFSVSVFVWSAAGLRAHASAPAGRSPSLSSRDFPAVALPPVIVEKKSLWAFPPPEQPPEILPDMRTQVPSPKPQGGKSPAAPMPPSSPLLPPKGDPALLLSLMEDKFGEIAKRMTALEHPKKDSAPPAYLEPLLKRVQEMEAEVKNLKFGFTQLASAQNALNINEVTAKIQNIQKMLETLTGGTDVSKPA